jgi:hypothetical protein
MKLVVIHWVYRERSPLKVLVPCDASEGSVPGSAFLLRGPGLPYGDFVLFREREGKAVCVNMNHILYYEIVMETDVDPLEGCF